MESDRTYEAEIEISVKNGTLGPFKNKRSVSIVLGTKKDIREQIDIILADINKQARIMIGIQTMQWDYFTTVGWKNYLILNSN